jgi:hypothetical protein
MKKSTFGIPTTTSNYFPSMVKRRRPPIVGTIEACKKATYFMVVFTPHTL